MELSSPAFKNEQPIPDEFTAFGKGVSPPLLISGTPPAAMSLALVVHDPDAPTGDFTHWLIWNISATASVIPEGRVPTGAVEGVNGYGKTGYGPPKPPFGKHRYLFELYALNAQLTLTPNADQTMLKRAMEGHIIAATQLMGTVSAKVV